MFCNHPNTSFPQFNEQKVGVHSVTVIVVGNGLCESSSNLDKAVCIPYTANNLWKGIHPTILKGRL